MPDQMSLSGAHIGELVLTYVVPFWLTSKSTSDASSPSAMKEREERNADPSAPRPRRRHRPVMPLAFVICCHPYLREKLELRLPRDTTPSSFPSYSHMHTRRMRALGSLLPYEEQHSSTQVRPAVVPPHVEITVTHLPLKDTGLPRLLWWLERCAAQQERAIDLSRRRRQVPDDGREDELRFRQLNAFGVALHINVKKHKAESSLDFSVDTDDGINHKATKRLAFHELSFSGINFTPRVFRDLSTTLLPVTHSGTPSQGFSVRFEGCSCSYDPLLRDADFTQFSTTVGKDDAKRGCEAYSWGSITKVSFSKSGGAGFWDCVKAFVLNPQLKESGLTAAVSAIHDLDLGGNKIAEKELPNIMRAVACRGQQCYAQYRATHPGCGVSGKLLHCLHTLDLSWLNVQSDFSWLRQEEMLYSNLKRLNLSSNCFEAAGLTDALTQVCEAQKNLCNEGVATLDYMSVRWSRHLTDDSFIRPLSRAGLRVRELWMGGTKLTYDAARDNFALSATP